MEDLKMNYIFDYEGWRFKVHSFNEMQNAYKISAEKDGLYEVTFLEAIYIENEEAFMKECRRFYINRLDTME